VFRILSESSELVEKLQNNVVQFRTQMKAAGFTVSGADTHAIAPVSFVVLCFALHRYCIKTHSSSFLMYAISR
jgi:7-keto-8-aminopelargonate synthetase-like enzyme